MLYYGDGVGIESSENSIEKLPTLEWTTVKNGLGRDESKVGPEFGMANVLTKHYETLDRDIGIGNTRGVAKPSTTTFCRRLQ